MAQTTSHKGKVIIVPGSRNGPFGANADDILASLEVESDARRFWVAMRLRFGQFALELHEDKTRLLEFGRFAAPSRKQRGSDKPETFTFLDLIFICGKSRRGATGRGQDSKRSRRDCVNACTTPSLNKANG